MAIEKQQNIEEDILDDKEVYYNKPNLVIRVKSMVIDSFVVVALMFVAFFVLDSIGFESRMVIGISLTLIFLYEPIMTSLSRTIGQKIMGIRVRKFKRYKNKKESKNINILSSLLRFTFKLLLGWLSLLGIHSDTYGQAFHDKISNSLMTIER